MHGGFSCDVWQVYGHDLNVNELSESTNMHVCTIERFSRIGDTVTGATTSRQESLHVKRGSLMAPGIRSCRWACQKSQSMRLSRMRWYDLIRRLCLMIIFSCLLAHEHRILLQQASAGVCGQCLRTWECAALLLSRCNSSRSGGMAPKPALDMSRLLRQAKPHYPGAVTCANVKCIWHCIDVPRMISPC